MRNSQPLIQSDPTLASSLQEAATRADAGLERHSVTLLRVSIGVIFLWFGVLKFFTGLSPAEQIAIHTLQRLTLGLLSPAVLLAGLATFETLIGLCFTTGCLPRLALPLLLLHMAGTALPFLMFPAETFTHLPYAPTFLGQYILKNLIIVSSTLVLWRRWH